MIISIIPTKEDIEAIADLPHDPSIEEDDLFDYSSVVIDKPWGFEYSIYKNDMLDVWLLRLESSQQTSLHCHPGKDTSLIALSGRLSVSTLTSTHCISSGDTYVLPAAHSTPHSVSQMVVR